MGYDFTLMRFDPSAAISFPCGYEAAPQTFLDIPWLLIRQHLLAGGAREDSEPDRLRIERPGGHRLWLHGGPGSIALDVHADWEHILALYQDLLPLAPGLVIFDDQDGSYHDEASFRAFMAEAGYPRRAA